MSVEKASFYHKNCQDTSCGFSGKEMKLSAGESPIARARNKLRSRMVFLAFSGFFFSFSHFRRTATDCRRTKYNSLYRLCQLEKVYNLLCEIMFMLLQGRCHGYLDKAKSFLYNFYNWRAPVKEVSCMQHKRKRYTLNDIAQELGVNKATVSKALSGTGNLSAATRVRILEFADRCGYHPNAVAQSLARSKTFNIGLMMPADAGVFDMAFFRDCLQGVCQRAAQSGYDVLITMDSEQNGEQMDRLIRHHKIDGVIAMRSLVHSPMVGFLKNMKVPFVLIGSSSDPGVIQVDNDNRGGCRELTRQLIGKGYRHLALLGGDENNCVTVHRREGFLDACREQELPEEDRRVYLNTVGENRLRGVLADVFTRPTDCIVCMDDWICGLVLTELFTMGTRIPDDVCVASFYDSLLMERGAPSVTSVHFDAVKLGSLACGRMVDLLEGRTGSQTDAPEYSIIFRASTN